MTIGETVMIIGEITGEGVEAEAAVEAEAEMPKTEMTVEEIGVNTNKTIMTIRDKVKITLLGDERNTGIIMTIGTEVETVTVMVKERNGIRDEVKEMGTEVEVVDGTHTNNTLPQDISQPQIIKIQTTTGRRLWDIKHHTPRGHPNTQYTPRSRSSNIQCRARRHGHNKLLTFANYVKMLDILTTNANSPVNL